MLPVGRALAAVGISPNALTALGLVLNVGAGAVIATGSYQLGALAFLGASAFDALDGTVARAAGKTSRFGAFFDSLADRYAESAILIGLAVSHALKGSGSTARSVSSNDQSVSSCSQPGSSRPTCSLARCSGSWRQRPT